MREQAERLIRDKSGNGSMVTVWVERDGERQRLFALVTTHEIEESEPEGTGTEDQSGEEVHVSKIPIESLLSFIPEENNPNPAQLDLTFSGDDIPDLEESFESSIRIRRRTSQEMYDWGSEVPALCFEHWVSRPEIAKPDPDDVTSLLNELRDTLGLDLEDNLDHAGNILVVVEDPRAIVSMNETKNADELFDRRRRDEQLSQEGLLDIAEGWTIKLNSLDRDEVDITLRREEYGELLYEERLPLSPRTELSTDEAAEYGKEGNWPAQILVVTDDSGTWRYRTPEFGAPSASDEIVRVSKDGVMLDEYRQAVVRSFRGSVEILESGQSKSENNDLPPILYPQPDFESGTPEWERRISGFGPALAVQTWVVDDSDDYDEVMSEIHDQLSGVVKLLDPYLQPDRLSDFVDRAEDGTEIWVIVGHRSNYMNSMRSDFESCIGQARAQGKELHIKWAPQDNRTPIHDRFIVNENKGLTIGTSFNSLDKNFSMVYEVDNDDAGALERKFDEWWSDPVFKQRFDVELIGSTSTSS